MELVSHIANATFSSLIRTNQIQQSKCLKITAFKQKTFQIVKERTMREASRDHSRSHCCAGRTRANMGSSHRAYRVHDKAGYSSPKIAAKTGGANRDRTGDLLVANQTLSQLSYGP
jgi:hypothetical protein